MYLCRHEGNQEEITPSCIAKQEVAFSNLNNMMSDNFYYFVQFTGLANYFYNVLINSDSSSFPPTGLWLFIVSDYMYA